MLRVLFIYQLFKEVKPLGALQKVIRLVIGAGEYNPGWIHTQEVELSLLDAFEDV